MFPENLLANAKFVFGSGAVALGVGDTDGAIVDMAQDEGYDGIMVQVLTGDVPAGVTLNVQLQGSALADGSAPALENETGALAAAGAADQDSKFILLDTRCPVNRFVFSRIKRPGGTGAPIASVVYILYKARKVPVTQGADVVKSAFDWVLSS